MLRLLSDARRRASFALHAGAIPADADSLAVFAERQELDPGGFKRPADRVERARPGIAKPPA
jgi:hypothetical protein